MSLPSSEPLPEDINDIPPARQRHIRRLPRSATPGERQILLESLIELSSPTLTFFLLTLIGALFLGTALYFNDPALLITAVLILPALPPLFGLGLFPKTLKIGNALKSLISFVISFMLTLAAGALAGWLQKEGDLYNLGLIRFSAPYWLDMSLVGAGTLLGALIFLRQGKIPRLIGALLSYEVFVPFAVAGFGFVLGIPRLWPSALLSGFLHFVIAVFSAIFAFLLLGFVPKKALGWLLTLLVLALALGLLSFGLGLIPGGMIPAVKTSPTPTPIIIPTDSPAASKVASPTATDMPATSTLPPSPSPSSTLEPSSTPTATSTPTLTPEPTTYWGLVDSLNGAVVRESPDFEAPVITYVNDGNVIEIVDSTVNEEGTRWFQIQIDSEKIGWLLSSLVITPTPTPTP